MNHHLAWLIALGLAAGIAACDSKEVTPKPKTGAREAKLQARTPVGAPETGFRSRSIEPAGRTAALIRHSAARPTGTA